VDRTLEDAEPWWPEPVRAPEGAPNIVLINEVAGDRAYTADD
jgi:hypothetical protein